MKKILFLVDKIDPKKEALVAGLQGYLGAKAPIHLARFTEVTVKVSGDEIEIKIEGKDIREFSLVYFRRAGNDYFTLAATLGICLQSLKVPFFDHAFVKIGPAGNKLTSLVRLALAELPMIPLFFCWRTKILANADLIISQFGLPLIAKEINSHRGKGIFLIKGKADFDRVLATDPQSQFLFQKFLTTKKEYRLLVLGEKVAVWERKIPTAPGEFRSNVALGAREEFLAIKDLPAPMAAIAVAAAKALDYQIAGVDILVDQQEKLWLLEANRGPGLTYDDPASPEVKELAAFFARQLAINHEI
ncbi:hypothetical protein COT65_00880 [Candidatus Shapirobacteria bacterium CG09_land_8_20_14_0_10_47_13]|uniref:ATP-grasp domain-containing protein n=1 Tax=Candidatus Shapirobacteria bacterium CG09_land_8_20_14_0_10_47_13 TaxID=1974481 RepID=A0A2H0WQ93_9BACT|nr:MAG: hypothetical protein COT65_00880 [Candidatus Shapirobacteria bacterium CG09_land_8_20_14_0_10_47_13]